NGCDSIRMLQLLVHPKKYTLEDINICEGDSYFAGGANQFSSGVYADTLHTTFGCDSIVTTNLTVNANPKPNLGGDRSLCTGQPVIINPGVFKSYLWQDGTTGPTISINNTGEYWVKVTGDNNCTANDSLNIFSLLPSPTDFLDPADSICSYEKLSIGANKSYPDYQWSTGSRESHINIENAGVYSLTVTDVNGCSGMESITIYPKNCIKGFYIPNAFTPNNDGNNDIFKPMIFGNVITYSFVVYNSWGQKVFESNDLLKGWDGTFRGENPQADIFVWTCTYQFEGGNLENKKGTVMLVR